MNRTQKVAWLLLFSGTLGVAVLAYVQTGSIPVCLLTVILAGVAVATSLVHGVGILVQYGREGKHGQ